METRELHRGRLIDHFQLVVADIDVTGVAGKSQARAATARRSHGKAMVSGGKVVSGQCTRS